VYESPEEKEKEKEKEKDKEKNIKKENPEIWFEWFWKNYPNHRQAENYVFSKFKTKIKTFAKFKKLQDGLLSDLKESELMAKYKVWRESWRIPTAYLNQECYARDMHLDENYWKNQKENLTNSKATDYNSADRYL
jgi:hypothetical protein